MIRQKKNRCQLEMIDLIIVKHSVIILALNLCIGDIGKPMIGPEHVLRNRIHLDCLVPVMVYQCIPSCVGRIPGYVSRLRGLMKDKEG